MSLSYLPDLLCSEDSDDVISVGDSSAVDFPTNSGDEESTISGLIKCEQNYSCIDSICTTSSSVVDSSTRSLCVAWILKVHAFYGFQPVTAYLAVNYMDRFLSCHHLPQTSEWALQLLSVACLSLAAKMEEPLVPSLLELQVEGAKFIFEPKTIQRMELLILDILQWRLRSFTPFTYITFFACKLDVMRTCTRLLVARSIDIIMTNIRETSLLEYKPSCIAAAAILCAASEIPSLSFATPEIAESWCYGLSKDKVSNCYKLMQKYVVDGNKRKSIKVIPQLRVTAQITRTRSNCDDTLTSSFSFSTSSLSTSNNKRRKLHDNSLVNDNNYG